MTQEKSREQADDPVARKATMSTERPWPGEETLAAQDGGARAQATPPDMPAKSVEVEQKPRAMTKSQGLLDSADAQRFRSRWDSIQAQFVDDPRRSVTDAQQLLSEVLEALDKAFARGRDDLERQWDRSGDVATEDLRMTVQKYRTLFQRLLAA
jgi:hypothetical protein